MCCGLWDFMNFSIISHAKIDFVYVPVQYISSSLKISWESNERWKQRCCVPGPNFKRCSSSNYVMMLSYIMNNLFATSSVFLHSVSKYVGWKQFPLEINCLAFNVIFIHYFLNHVFVKDYFENTVSRKISLAPSLLKQPIPAYGKSR